MKLLNNKYLLGFVPCLFLLFAQAFCLPEAKTRVILNKSGDAYFKLLSSTLSDYSKIKDTIVLQPTNNAGDKANVGISGASAMPDLYASKSLFVDAIKALIAGLQDKVGKVSNGLEIATALRDLATFLVSDNFKRAFATKKYLNNSFFADFNKQSTDLNALAKKFDKSGATGKPREVEDSEAAKAALQKKLDEFAAANESLQTKLSSMEVDASKEPGLLNRFKKFFKSSEASVTEQKKLQAELDKASKLKEEKQAKALEEVGKKLDAAEAERNNSVTKITAFEAEIKKLKDELAGTKAENVELKKQLEENKAKVGELEKSLSEARSQINTSSTNLVKSASEENVKPEADKKLDAEAAKADSVAVNASAEGVAPAVNVAADGSTSAAEEIQKAYKEDDFDNITRIKENATMLLKSVDLNIGILHKLILATEQFDTLTENVKIELAGMKQSPLDEITDMFIPITFNVAGYEKETNLQSIAAVNAYLTQIISMRDDNLLDAKIKLANALNLYAKIIAIFGKSIKEFIDANSEKILATPINTSGIDSKNITIDEDVLVGGFLKNWNKSNYEKYVINLPTECSKYMQAVQGAYIQFASKINPAISSYLSAFDIFNKVARMDVGLNEVNKIFTKTTSWLLFSKNEFKPEFDTLNSELKDRLIQLANACIKQRAVNVILVILNMQQTETMSFDEIIKDVKEDCKGDPDFDEATKTFTKLVVIIGTDKAKDVVEISAQTSQAALDAINNAVTTKREVAVKSQSPVLVDKIVSKFKPLKEELQGYPLYAEKAGDTELEGKYGVNSPSFDDSKIGSVWGLKSCRNICENVFNYVGDLIFEGNNYALFHPSPERNDIITLQDKLKASSDPDLLALLKRIDPDKSARIAERLGLIAQAYAWLAIADKIVKEADLRFSAIKSSKLAFWKSNPEIAKQWDKVKPQAEETIKDAIALIQSGLTVPEALKFDETLNVQKNDEASAKAYIDRVELTTRDTIKDNVLAPAKAAYQRIKTGQFDGKTIFEWVKAIEAQAKAAPEESKPEEQKPAGEDKFTVVKTAFEKLDVSSPENLKTTVLGAAAAFDAAGKLDDKELEELVTIWDGKIATEIKDPEFTQEEKAKLKNLSDQLSEVRGLQSWITQKLG